MAYDPGVDSASKRNEYQKYLQGGGGKGGRCVGLTTLPPSCANCVEIWKPQPPGTLRACPGCNGRALPFIFTISLLCCSTVVKALCYESEGPWFDSR